LVRLFPGEIFSFDTEWLPARAGSEFHGATDAGIIVNPLQAVALETGKLRLSGSFGVFFSGKLVAHLYDRHGAAIGTIPVADADPTELASLAIEIHATGNPERVSLHLEDRNGVDRGALGEVRVATGSGKK
jgi:hypothetical protein